MELYERPASPIDDLSSEDVLRIVITIFDVPERAGRLRIADASMRSHCAPKPWYLPCTACYIIPLFHEQNSCSSSPELLSFQMYV